MSQFTINAVLTVLRLALVLIGKCVRLLYTIKDLVDDGCINASAPTPAWMTVLVAAINSLESIWGNVSSVEDDLLKPSDNGK